MSNHTTPRLHHPAISLAAMACCLNLTACGGGGEATTSRVVVIETTTTTTALAAPMFMRHADPVAEPMEDSSAQDPATLEQPQMAAAAVGSDGIPALVRGADEAEGATMPLEEAMKQGNPGQASGSQAGVQNAAGTYIPVFTPAHIRAAYGLPALPTSYANLSAAQAAALGAGQTIYVVDAYHYPNAERDLAAFSTKFGLPLCKTVPITTATPMPLSSASNAQCTLSVVPVTMDTKGAPELDSKLPSYNSAWAQEAALDIQWAHAIAPLARIVLLESRTNNVADMSVAVRMAARMGPGSVSMSFAANEGSWTSSYDTAFRSSGLSYLAATGDWGAKAMWPSVSATVLAIGGTTLGYTGGNTRTERAWSMTGGGISAFTLMPSYQSATALPAQSIYNSSTKASVKMRGVADVAFNADPGTPQYVAFTAPGSNTTGWYAYGGTSISTPQWAGLVAIANAQRALKGKAPLGQNLHQALYDIASNATNYRLAFSDVMTGANGSCTACRATAGYDTPTGLGTPNVSSLLTLLQNR
jgi:subtilase family serine protease